MSIFNRKKKNEVPIVVEPPAQSRVEIELHKGATQEAAKKAKEVNSHLTDILVENGFTLKIAIAAGAQIKQKKRGGN